MRVLEHLLDALSKATEFNQNVQVAPAAILWPDKEKQWLSLSSELRKLLPQFLTLGEYKPKEKTGPAIWLKCMIARTLPEADWPEEAVPIIYLPDVSRQELRAVESCPKQLQPLAELQYRGTFWSQASGRDWTILAFLKSKDAGLCLDVSESNGCKEAMARALPQLAETPVSNLEGRRLEASDFDHLLITDPVRDLLHWLNDPAGARQKWNDDQWGAFCSACKDEYSFDPQGEGELIGAERMGMKEGKWAQVWSRFAESPRLYPNIPDLLRKAEPQGQGDLFSDRIDKSSWPKINDGLESGLRKALLELKGISPHEASEKLKELEKSHGERRGWVWAQLGQSPLAFAIEYLASMVEHTATALTGSTPQDMGDLYAEKAWKVDKAVLKALACADSSEDMKAITAAIRAVYMPWLEGAAERLQSLVEKSSYPGHEGDNLKPISPGERECIVFADGLRFDVGQILKDELERKGFQVDISSRWASLPTVTATSKPAVSPVADKIAGNPGDENFQPRVAESNKPLNSNSFGKLIEAAGIQYLGKEEGGDPMSKGWTECGELDHTGHEQGWKLAMRIDEEIKGIIERIEGLSNAGWRKMHVVTDHGWLLMPGGLPKQDLPKYLVETRWGRCAILKETTKSSDLLIQWRWSEDVHIALGRGISCFKAGMEYAHGGLSLQECLTPVLTVVLGGKAAEAKIGDVKWMGMRCKFEVEDAGLGMKVDIRTKPADKNSSIIGGSVEIGDDNKASLLVDDDSYMGTAAVVVLLDHQERVIAKESTTVPGGEENGT